MSEAKRQRVDSNGETKEEVREVGKVQEPGLVFVSFLHFLFFLSFLSSVNFINGKTVPGSSGKWMDVESPADGKTVAKVSLSTPADVEAAVKAAHDAWPAWRSLTVKSRAAVRSPTVVGGSRVSPSYLPMHRSCSRCML